jgi:23S rRNA pseudouridine1911/1915/1917 synthase
MSPPLAVLFEDAHVLAVAKPAGLLTQGRPGGEPTLEDAVRARQCPDAPGSVYLGTVHRLDRPVSGVVVWARTPKAARRLSAQFAARETIKEYWAIVAEQIPGALLPVGSLGIWDDWITGAVDASGLVRAAAADERGARRAVTRFRVARGAEGAGWLQLWPETGRTHQIRAQASLHGLAIRGDTAYGSVEAFPQGIALHARALTFRHPVLRREVVVTAEWPAAWREQGVDGVDAPSASARP